MATPRTAGGEREGAKRQRDVVRGARVALVVLVLLLLASFHRRGTRREADQRERP